MGARNFLAELRSQEFKLLGTDRPFFCRSLALVRISRELVQPELKSTLPEDAKQIENLLSVIISIKHALKLSQVEVPNKVQVDEAFRDAAKCIQAYVRDYLQNRLENVQEILIKGARGDANVKKQISMSNLITEQMLHMFQSTLPFSLILYPPASVSKQDALTVPCHINQEMTLDSLLCRMPPEIAGWKFSLALNPFCYSEDPTVEKSFTSNMICALDVFGTMEKTRILMPSKNLYIVMDREFSIRIDWLSEPPRIFGNVWPLQKNQASVAMKTLTGDIILKPVLRIEIWEDLRDRKGTEDVDIPEPGRRHRLTSKPVHDLGLTSSSSQSTLVAEEAPQKATTTPSVTAPSFNPKQSFSQLGHGSLSVSTLGQPIPVAQPSVFSASYPLPSTDFVRAIPVEQTPIFPLSPPLPSPPFLQEVSSERSPSLPISPPSGRTPVFAIGNPVVEPPPPSNSTDSRTPFPAQTFPTLEPLLPPTSSPSNAPSSDNATLLNHTRQKSSTARGYDGSRGGSTSLDVTLDTQAPYKQGFSVQFPTRPDTITETPPVGRMKALPIKSQKPLSWFERGKKFVKDVVTGVMK